MVTRMRLNVTLNVHDMSCLFLYWAAVTKIRKTNTCWLKNGYCCAAVCEWIIAAIRRRAAVPSKHIRPNPRVFCVSLIASLTLTINAWLMKMCRDSWNTYNQILKHGATCHVSPSSSLKETRIISTHTHIHMSDVYDSNSSYFLEEHKVTFWSW